MFCEKCGAEIQPGMTNCPTCGAPVAPQAAPQQAAPQQAAPQMNYQQPQQQYQQPQQQMYQQAPQQPNAAGAYLKRLIDTYKVVFKDPIGIGKQFVQSGDAALAAGFMLLQSILVAFFGMIVEAQTYGKAYKSIIGIASVFGGSKGHTGFEAPYAKVFFGTLLFSLLFQVILVLCIFLAMMIIKNNITWQQAAVLASLRSITVAPIVIIAMILILINPVAGLFVFFAGSIWGLILIAIDLPLYNTPQSGLVYMLLFIAIVVAMIVKLLLMTKVGYKFYLPDALLNNITKDLPDLKKSFSLDSLLEDLY